MSDQPHPLSNVVTEKSDFSLEQFEATLRYLMQPIPLRKSVRIVSPVEYAEIMKGTEDL